jgi:hypothetical protein
MKSTVYNPDGYQTVDARTEQTWIEKAKFRSPDVRLRGKRQKPQKTTGEFYASKAWKRDHPEFGWEGVAKDHTGKAKRIVRNGETVKRLEG